MILDPACGSKMFWFEKDSSDVVFGDVRCENHVLCDGRSLIIRPDVQMSYAALPFRSEQFNMVVFDPPHLVRLGKNSWMAKKYGKLNNGWQSDMAMGFSECFRVLKVGGTLIFKWNERDIPVSEIVKLANVKPIFGHKSGAKSQTHWLCFVKQEAKNDCG
jgi:hypothetical protein